MKKNLKFTIYFLAISLTLFARFGHDIWKPVYYKMRGKKTCADRYSEFGLKNEEKLKPLFKSAALSFPPSEITLIALKTERTVELWADNKLVKTYPFTGFSGKVGPKLEAGDGQIPEGVYHIEYLNPNSLFYLSMKVSYPNEFDQAKAKEDGREHPGSDIFIHGKNDTIGCIPVGDTAIEELFTLAYLTGKDNIKVIISPFDMRTKELPLPEGKEWYTEKYDRIKTELKTYSN